MSTEKLPKPLFKDLTFNPLNFVTFKFLRTISYLIIGYFLFTSMVKDVLEILGIDEIKSTVVDVTKEVLRDNDSKKMLFQWVFQEKAMNPDIKKSIDSLRVTYGIILLQVNHQDEVLTRHEKNINSNTQRIYALEKQSRNN